MCNFVETEMVAAVATLLSATKNIKLKCVRHDHIKTSHFLHNKYKTKCVAVRVCRQHRVILFSNFCRKINV